MARTKTPRSQGPDTWLGDLEQKRRESAMNKVGGKPLERLQWLIEFVRKDVAALDPGERIPLGYELRAIAGGFNKPDDSRGWVAGARPLDDITVIKLHAAIKGGVMTLFGKASIGTWEFKSPEIFEVYRAGSLKSKRIAFGRLTQFGPGHEEDAIMYGVAEILLDANRTLRACAECTLPFIPVRRQEYCSTNCSQKARNKKRKKK